MDSYRQDSVYTSTSGLDPADFKTTDARGEGDLSQLASGGDGVLLRGAAVGRGRAAGFDSRLKPTSSPVHAGREHSLIRLPGIFGGDLATA